RQARRGRERSRRLGRRGAPPEVARAVGAELESRGYLDDAAFARRWAEVRARTRRLGPIRLRRELYAKGIAPDVATPAVQAAFADVSEEERALEAGRRKLTGIKRAGPERAPGRLAGQLLRAGYPPSVVRRVVKQLLGADLRADDDPADSV